MPNRLLNTRRSTGSCYAPLAGAKVMTKQLISEAELDRYLNEALLASGLCEGVMVSGITRVISDSSSVANWDVIILRGHGGVPVPRECILAFIDAKDALQRKYDLVEL